jgi:hypothetical protein
MVSPEVIILIGFLAAVVLYSLWPPKLLKNPVIAGIFIPLVLLGAWVGLILYQSYKIEEVVTLLTDEYSHNSLNGYKEGELYKGDIVSGTFKARENYLGIIGVRFWNNYRLNDDYVIFRLREAGTPNWYYENRYKADQFQPNDYFTFGFPVIERSKDKLFEFQVESEGGRPGVAISISEISPVFIAKYKYPHSEVLGSREKIARFAVAKIANLTRKASFNAASFIYLLPLVLYIISLVPIPEVSEKNSSNKKYKGKNIISIYIYKVYYHLARYFVTRERKLWFSSIAIFLGTVSEIIISHRGEVPLIMLVVLWFFVYRTYQVGQKFFLVLTVFFFLLSGFTYYLGSSLISERSGGWAWIFILAVVLLGLKNRPSAAKMEA